MYDWIPTKNPRKATRLIMLFFLGAGLLLATTVAFGEMPYRWAVQLVALGLLTAAVFLTTRYVMKSYRYRIFPDDRGGYDLTVSELTSGGKRQVTVCRVGLDGIEECLLLDMSRADSAEKWKAIKKERRKLFDYCVDLSPEKSILVSLREGGADLTLRLSYDRTLWELLNAHAPREDV